MPRRPLAALCLVAIAAACAGPAAPPASPDAPGASPGPSGTWWMWLFPGVAIMVAVLALNLLGDALTRDTSGRA